MKTKTGYKGLIKKAGSPYYWTDFCAANGKRIRKSTGTSNKRQAIKILKLIQSDSMNDKFQVKEVQHYFDDLMKRYFRDNPQKKCHDEQFYRVLSGFFKSLKLNSFSPRDVSDYIQFRRKRGVSDSSIRRELGFFSGRLNEAIYSWGWDIPNPILKRKPKASMGRIRWLTENEVTKMISLAKRESKTLHLAHFIQLAAYTGMRTSEVLSLEWSRFDKKNRLIYLNPKDNKSSRFHSIPLHKKAMEVLIERASLQKEMSQQPRWVFHNQNGGRIKSIKKSFRTLCQNLGIDDFTPHDLRHTFAAWLVQKGVPMAEIKQLLNHSSIQVTEKYAHLSPENGRKAVELL